MALNLRPIIVEGMIEERSGIRRAGVSGKRSVIDL